MGNSPSHTQSQSLPSQGQQQEGGVGRIQVPWAASRLRDWLPIFCSKNPFIPGLHQGKLICDPKVEQGCETLEYRPPQPLPCSAPQQSLQFAFQPHCRTYGFQVAIFQGVDCRIHLFLSPADLFLNVCCKRIDIISLIYSIKQTAKLTTVLAIEAV